MINKDILIIMALEDECQGYFVNENIRYVGVGKVNASYGLMNAINHHKPKLVINLGSAGSNIFARGELVNCTKFVQRDMDCVELGFQNYVTPFDANSQNILHYGKNISDLTQGICGTGDNFYTSLKKDTIYNLVDMEAYALAKICELQNIEFICIKYITDGADSNAANDWSTSLKLAAKNLFKQYQKLFLK